MTNTTRQLTTQAVCLMLAATVTLAMLGGVNHLAVSEQGTAQAPQLAQQQVGARA